MYDFIVVGAGIAGIATAEILQRSGSSVLLIESEKYACAEASSQQAGWFHMGALYAALPDRSFSAALVKNLDLINAYYKDFENMNLLSRDENILFTKSNGWFSDNIIYYYYISYNAKEIEFWRKLPWWLVIQSVRHGKNKYKRFIKEINHDTLSNLRLPKIGKSQASLVLSSQDRTMDTRLIAIDLLRSFLGNGGEIRFSTTVISIGKSVVKTSSSEIINSRHVIVTAGEKTRNIANVNLRVVVSPVAVIFPALTTHNFVKVTPSLSKTFNHLYHPLNETGYSVVGNASYFSEINEEIKLRVRNSFYEAINNFFPRISGNRLDFYYGHKTEIVGVGQLRNYQSHIVDTDTCLIAVPGKFSLAFSLAVNICRHYGVVINPKLNNLIDYEKVNNLVAYPEHYNKALELAKL